MADDKKNRWNIVYDYDWTSAPRGSEYRKKAPAIYARSYRLISNQITQSLRTFLNITKQSGAVGSSTGDISAKEFYDQMYQSSVVEEEDYYFPYFDDSITNYTNAFADTFQGAFGQSDSSTLGGSFYEKAKGVTGEIATIGNLDVASSFQNLVAGNPKAAFEKFGEGMLGSGNPGTYVETPQFYSFGRAMDSALRVSFVLANTLNSDSIQNNYDFVQHIMKVNRPRRNTSISVDPPRIYKVLLKGHRLIRWAYCNNISVDMMGTKRLINNVIHPEAYKITLSFLSLTLEHAGFIDDAPKELSI